MFDVRWGALQTSNCLKFTRRKEGNFQTCIPKKWCRRDIVRATEVYFPFAIVLTHIFRPFKYELFLPITVGLISFEL